MKSIFERARKAPEQVKASIAFLICTFLSRGVAVITTPIFTRMMTTSEYGRFGVFNSWVSIFACFMTLNLSGGITAQSLVKFPEEREKYKASFQGLTFFMCLCYAFIYILFHNVVNSFLGYTTIEMILMIIIVWSSAVYQLWSSGQRVDYRYKLMSLISISATLLMAVLGILFVHSMKDKVLGRILGWALTQTALYLWLFFYEIRRGKIVISKEIWSYALRLAIPLIPHYLSTIILNSSDRIMISKMVSEGSAGVYTLAYSLSLIMSMFNTSLLSTLEPWIYKQINSMEFGRIERIAYPSFVGVAGLNIMLIAFAPEILHIFAPSEYYGAIWIIPPVAMSVYFMFMYAFYATFEFYYEKTKYITIATVSGAIINIVTNYIFIKIFGYIAAGYTTLLCYIIFALMHYLFMHKITREKLSIDRIYDIKKIIGITVIFIGLGFAFMTSYNYAWIRYIMIILLVLLVFCFKKRIIAFGQQLLNAKNDR